MNYKNRYLRSDFNMAKNLLQNTSSSTESKSPFLSNLPNICYNFEDKHILERITRLTPFDKSF